jgi:lipopolysaccharide export LptBFGC system permease protein LptF
MQTKINNGWHNIKEDVEIAIQVHRYPNWQNLDELGYPNRSDGTNVTSNTYERVAWATAGAKIIIKNPQGAGMLSYPISLLTQGNLKFATHSGWVELGLAFGVPILGLIFTALSIILINAARKFYPAGMSVLGMVVFTFCFYLIGEATIQHGLEILYFLLALLPALLLTKLKNN